MPIVEKEGKEGKEGKVEMLVQALFFARWCNRDMTLNELDPALLADPAALRRELETVPRPPWCNETAYPVEVVTWEGTEYSRLEAATALFASIAPWLVEAIRAAGGERRRSHLNMIRAPLAGGRATPSSRNEVL